jgi:hypothetical protein
MKPVTTEKVKRYSLIVVGVSAYLLLVFALFMQVVGRDLSQLSFT